MNALTQSRLHLTIAYMFDHQFVCVCVPRSRPWAQFWTKSWSAPLTDVSCSPGACPQTCGTGQLQRRLLQKTMHNNTTSQVHRQSVMCAQSVFYECILTNALVTGVQQLSEGCGGSFSFDCLGSFLVLSQFTQHTCCHTLDILHWRIQQLETANSREKEKMFN